MFWHIKVVMGGLMMRYEFNDENVQISNIRPTEIFNKELRLILDFIEENSISFQKIENCNITNNERKSIIFKKFGLPFALCPETWNISMAQYPSQALINSYYFESKLAQYRATEEYQNEVTFHRKEIWKAQMEWIEGRINRYVGHEKYSILDYGCKWTGWQELWANSSVAKSVFFSAPLPPIKAMEPKQKIDVVCLLDVLQRELLPNKLMSELHDSLNDKGLLILTVRSGTGFDILTLKENSSVQPLDHINLPSPEGVQYLLENNGFEILEISTPGLLDVEYVEENSSHLENDFIKYLFSKKNTNVKADFQHFLQRNNLSSYVRVVARRKERNTNYEA